MAQPNNISHHDVLIIHPDPDSFFSLRPNSGIQETSLKNNITRQGKVYHEICGAPESCNIKGNDLKPP
jgi:hypothetical protein